ncbi:MAG: FemAB family PEP-CTERM system-associated protein [Planctomycetes bacterium]|nr:FemAB family PEP-CTERM system-associated protein [Planctomycetota bacterium]
MVSFANPNSDISIKLLSGAALAARFDALREFAQRGRVAAPSADPAWLNILREGLGHVPFAFEASRRGATCGWLPLAYVRSTLFGRYLVSLPYLNTGGVQADDPAVALRLIHHAADLAREMRVKHLELRNEQPVEHPLLDAARTNKVHMRLALPSFPGPMWEELPAKVRNQVRKGEKAGLVVEWGGAERLDDFYDVFSHNMRDLGTPVYSRQLFAAIIKHFNQDAEFCVIRHEGKAIAAALLVHGKGITEVPSASSLREFNSTCANMLMYWNLIDRAIQRGQSIFDFGRSTLEGNTFRFKKQWGALPEPATWQYHLITGKAPSLRPDNPRYQRLIKIWQKLPVRVTRVIGPRIVRGIP